MPDTAAERRSAAGVPFLPCGPGVTPDSSQPRAWRQQAAWGYSGILAVTVHVITGTWEVPSWSGTWEVPSWTGSWE
jgi:hypothetical protein